jgi:hypothetical protein
MDESEERHYREIAIWKNKKKRGKVSLNSEKRGETISNKSSKKFKIAREMGKKKEKNKSSNN